MLRIIHKRIKYANMSKAQLPLSHVSLFKYVSCLFSKLFNLNSKIVDVLHVSPLCCKQFKLSWREVDTFEYMWYKYYILYTHVHCSQSPHRKTIDDRISYLYMTITFAGNMKWHFVCMSKTPLAWFTQQNCKWDDPLCCFI